MMKNEGEMRNLENSPNYLPQTLLQCGHFPPVCLQQSLSPGCWKVVMQPSESDDQNPHEQNVGISEHRVVPGREKERSEAREEL
jgi:hypothetical protein